ALAAAVDDAAPPERRLLTAAALVDTAATVAVDDPRPLEAAFDPSPAPAEPCPVAPPRAAAALHQLLASGGQVPVAPLLAGWLTTARQRGWRVPPHLLPAVLATIEDDPSALPPDAAALGDRAVWLLAATRALPRTAERLLPPPPPPAP